MVITGLTRNQFAAQAARGFESHRLRQKDPDHNVVGVFVPFGEGFERLKATRMSVAGDIRNRFYLITVPCGSLLGAAPNTE